MRYDLLNMLSLRYGSKAKNELLALEGRIRKERQDAVYRAEEIRQKIVDGLAITAVLVLLTGFVGWVLWMKYG